MKESMRRAVEHAWNVMDAAERKMSHSGDSDRAVNSVFYAECARAYAALYAAYMGAP